MLQPIDLKDEILTHETACKLLKVSRITLYHWLKEQNPPPHLKIGPKNGVTIFTKESLLEWQREHKPRTLRS